MATNLLTIKDVSRELSLTTRSVYKLTKEGKIPVVRLGDGENSPIRIRREDLDAWVESRVTRPEEPAA